jgi:hypothetical protein
VLAVAQNLLMKKHGISTGSELHSQDFEACIQLFEDELSEEQAQLVQELIKISEHVASPAVAVGQ